MAQDYYQTLGILKTASADEIKKAYRKLAHEHHPDKGRGDAEKFKQINEAYQVLSNPDKRQAYDRFGSVPPGGFAGGGNYQGAGFDPNDFARGFGFNGGVEFEDAFDIFSDIFGGGGRRANHRERGIDLEMDLDLNFTEAVFGVEKEIRLEKKDVCEHCSGSGAEPGSKVSTCPKCHGTGQIKTARRTIFGTMSSATTCDQCEGTGKVPERACVECKGTGNKKRAKTIRVKVPAGVDDGMRIRIANEGEAGYRGSHFGDLYLRLHVRPDPKFRREGANIYSEASISMYQAALGTTIEVPTVDGGVKVKIPPGTQSEKVFRLKSSGVPYVNDSGRGDHFVTIHVMTPSKLSKKEKELFKKLAEANGEEVDEGFWDKFKN